MNREFLQLAPLSCAVLAVLLVLTPSPGWTEDGKQELLRSIDENAELYWQAALRIWSLAEPGYQETESAALLAQLFEDAGFRVERGVAQIPTAFTATYGSGSPVVAVLGEYDALPGLSQESVPYQATRPGNGYGHGCGHHLLGVGGAAAALTVARGIRQGKVGGTIRFYGTPAEEGGGAKVFMVRAGLFEDVDAVLHWHPGDRNTAGDPSNMARIAAKFRFRGKSAHAAAAPEQGRSALDAVELMNHAAELMREHTPDQTRIHHVTTAGGRAPNVVPDFAEVYYYVRHPRAEVVRSLYQRLLKCARAGALATETEVEVEYLGGIHNLLSNDVLSQVSRRNFQALADLSYTEEEVAWARELQKTLTEPADLASIQEVIDLKGTVTKGSTDVGDVSWVVPTTGIGTATWVPGTPAHSWQATAAGGTTIGRKGMLLAARVLAATAWDLLQDPSLLDAAQEELGKRTGGYEYSPMLEPQQGPPLDYRNPPAGN